MIVDECWLGVMKQGGNGYEPEEEEEEGKEGNCEFS
jgi:hypothetical protein